MEKTRNDYNAIAEDFSETRKYLPPDRKNLLLQYITSGDKVLDLGCGNGRFSDAFNNVDYIGVDNSKEMIKIARAGHAQADFQVADALNLPFPDNYFDKVFSFAVFHHIPSKELRAEFLKEAKRILKPQGLLLLTVWNLNPLKMVLIGEKERTKDLLKYQIFKIFGRSKLDFGDFFVSWRNIVPRYIHFFTISGLKKMVENAGFKIKSSGNLKSFNSKESNIYIVAQKS